MIELKIDMPDTTILITLLVAMLAALAAHRLTLSREREKRRKDACQKFRDSVITELSGLYPIPTQWPVNDINIIDLLKSKFPSLQAAVEEFRPFVPWYKRRCFERAWHVYRLGKDGLNADAQYYWQYVPHSGSGIEKGKHVQHDNTKTYKENFKKNVDNLLKYAK